MAAQADERRGRRLPDAARAGLATALVATAIAAAIAVLLASDAPDPPAAAPGRAAAFVPASARVVVELDRERDRFGELRGALRRLPAIEGLALAALDGARAPSRAPDPLAPADLAPWMGREVAFALLGSGGTRRDWVALYETRDAAAARQALAEEIGAGRSITHARVLLRSAGDVVHGAFDGFALVGSEGGVRAAIDARRGALPALARHSEYRRLAERLPGGRVASAYASAAGLRERLRGPATGLAALTGATELRAAAAALTLEDDRGRITLRAQPVRDPVCGSGGDAAGRLLDEAPADAAAYVGISEPGCAWHALYEARLDPGRALERFARATRRAGVDLVRDAPPLIADGAALVVTGSGSDPGALSLVVSDADRRRALDLLGLLAPALAETIAPVPTGRAPAFEAREVGGLRALAAQIAPGLELAYAASDERVAVSTALAGLTAVVEGEGLAAADQRRAGLSGRPADAAALVFLDLDQLLALAEQTGVAEGGAQLVVRDDLQRLGPVSGVVGVEDKTTTAELLFQNP